MFFEDFFLILERHALKRYSQFKKASRRALIAISATQIAISAELEIPKFRDAISGGSHENRAVRSNGYKRRFY